MKNIDWSGSHCGVMLCSFDETIKLMPEVKPILGTLMPHLELSPNEYVVDVKVHHLMPGQYPCIPNWHRDFIPRDHDLKQIREDMSDEKMYIWVSGEPETEWINKPKTIDTWRCFIRVIPKKFIHSTTINIGQLRRHLQVYIDEPNKFRW